MECNICDENASKKKEHVLLKGQLMKIFREMEKFCFCDFSPIYFLKK